MNQFRGGLLSLLGLKWEDVDLEAGTLQVRQVLSQTKGGPAFTPSKSAKSHRRIKLTGGAVSALKRHRKRQLEERMECGGLWEDNRLVFPNATGGSVHPWTLGGPPSR